MVPSVYNVCIRLAYRPIVLEYGMWDQVRVDCGREFALMLYVQQSLSAHRTNTQRAPYLQTASTMVSVHVAVPDILVAHNIISYTVIASK